MRRLILKQEKGKTNMKKKKKIEKSGLYIAICCCAVIIAAVGYAGEKNTDNIKEDIAQSIRNDEIIIDDVVQENKDYLADGIEIIETPVITPEPELAKEIINEEIPVAKTVEVEEITFKMPVEGRVVCEFSGDKLLYNDFLSDWRTHNGIDISCDKDSAVYASADGRIKSIYDDSMGKNVVIEHRDGYMSVYANMSDRIEITEGAEIKKGDLIGKVGDTALGDFTEESHLHFELLKDEQYINPVDYIE